MRNTHILTELKRIHMRLDQLETRLKPATINIQNTNLYELPDHLRKTYLTIIAHGEQSAEQVAHLTGRARATESHYLNTLTRQGWLHKKQGSKTITFHALK